ncbi:bcl-2-binding component 3 [Megalops cyprinoides]|uniref:bcl-2-binding component 3 n=1 Tax=Megalops cyprinoides TaxID=118141 RepID=UPI0018652F04|nr:bcl-2-binding component 3 [Megalops cyprinoides]
MARPQTDGGVDGSGQAGRQSCRMEALRPDALRQDAWPRGGLHVPQPGYPPCHPRRDTATQTAPSAAALVPRVPPAPVPSAPPSAREDIPVRHTADVVCPHAGSEGELGTGVERPCDGQPLPDLLPQRQHPLEENEENGAAGGDPELDDEVSGRVADQLRVIGDEMNAMLLQRRNAAQQLQDWRGLCWGLFTLITDTLSTLYLRRHR